MQGFLTIPRADTTDGRDPAKVNHRTGIWDKIVLPLPSSRHTRGAPPPATRPKPNYFAQETL